MKNLNETEGRGRKLISVVIPCYNEVDNVERAYAAVKEVFTKSLTDYDFEVVFTDNHSEDGTFDRIEQLAKVESGIQAVRFSRNFGFNRSLLSGYRMAKGDAAVQLDCDLQDPPELIKNFVEQWENGHDVVVGIRAKREESFLLTAMRKIFYRLLNRISDDYLMVDGGDFRLVDREILNQLVDVRDAYPYVRGIISYLARSQVGVSYERARRVHGLSKFPILRLTTMAVDGITSQSTAPLRLATLFGGSIAFLTFCGGVLYAGGRLVYGQNSWPDGFATIVGLILFGISLNAMFMGIIGEYVARIYEQSKVRPTVVVEKKLPQIVKVLN